MESNFFLGLVYNASLLLALVLIFQLSAWRFKRSGTLFWQVIVGILLGVICLAVMQTNWVLIPGVIFDARSVLLGVTGLFLGWIPTLMAMIMATVYRISLGGGGVYMGVAVIISSGLIGLIWRSFRQRDLHIISLAELYVFGLVIHIAMLMLTSLLPAESRGELLSKIWFPVITIYPVATLLLGTMLSDCVKRDMVKATLRKTERVLRLLNDKVLSEKQKLEAILHDIGDAVFVTDPEKRIVLANIAMEKLFGLPEKEMTGKNIKEVINLSYESSGKEPEDLIDTVFNKKKLARPAETLTLKAKNGTKISVDGVASPVMGRNEELVGTVWVLRDVTKQRELEKMRADFISLASHQMRTPLTGIKWFVELLKGEVTKTSGESMEKYVNSIGESNQRLIDLVNDLLVVSKNDEGMMSVRDLESCLIKKICLEAVELQGKLFADKNIRLGGADQIPEKYEVRVDKIQMVQVFGNLLNNAGRYSPAGSKIDIRVEKKRIIQNSTGLLPEKL